MGVEAQCSASIPATVAGTLGVKEAGGEPLLEILKDYLREKRMLLVLDNFEQVLEAAPMVTELLSAAPRLTVLATSCIPLRLYGEHEFTVPPLSLPDPKHPQPVEHLTQYEGVRLFIERAKAVKADFSVTNNNALAVAKICAHLDGLPLAIELAAARIKLLPPQAMLTRLGHRLKLLTGGARDLPERQRTLRGTIKWSHELLDEDEKMLFAGLAVFAGGCTLEAMEAVCDAEGDLSLDHALEGASSLLEKSLLRQEEGAEESEPRFSMLETISEYAQERLEESGEAEEIRRLHAEFYLALAEEAEPRVRGPEALNRKQGNVLEVATVLNSMGYAELARGNKERARALLEESLPLNRELGNKLGVAHCLMALGIAETLQGEPEWAKALLKESLAIDVELDSKAEIAETR